MFVEKNCLTFNFYDKKKLRSLHKGGIAKGIYKDLKINTAAYRVKFVDCNPNPLITKQQAGADYENFFIGSDKSKWKGNVKNYHQVWLKDLYPLIDYEMITSAQGFKYNFRLRPGGAVENIRLNYEGVEKIKLKNGALVITLEVNEVTEQKPYAYQLIDGEIKQVKCHYKLDKNLLTFDVGDYNKNYELVIDPVLLFAAQSGSTADNFGMTATYDLAGNLYAGGTVFDVGYPTVNAYDNSFNGTPAYGITDIVITKYNSTGTSLIYSTYLGGTETEIVTSLITDSNNNLYLYGATSSTDFPMPGSPYDASFNGGNFMSFQFNGTTFNNGTDIYIAKLGPAGSTLLAATFIGGNGNDGVNYNNYAPPIHTVFPCFAPGGFNLTNEYPADSLQYNYGDQYRGEIQLDKNGDVYVASSTKSANFPVVNAFQNSLNGKQDAVVFKMNNTLTNLLWSSFLGGSGNDAGYSLLVDDTLQTFVTGGTYSTDFPTVAGCYQTSPGGGKADGYLVKIKSTGTQLLKATYIGTTSYDQSYLVQSDRIGRIYVFGQSSGNMTVTPGVYSNPGSHQFIKRFNSQLTGQNVISTVIGSGQPTIDISPSAFSVDKCSGSISLSGWGGNFINCLSLNNMPISVGALQSTPPNGHDFYFMVIHPNFTGLKYGTYFGGNSSEEHVDGGTSRISESGVLYQSVCAGCGGNDDFPVSPGAWPCSVPGNCPPGPNFSSNCNNGVIKFDYEPKVTATVASNTISGCNPLTVNFTNLSSPGLQYLWNLGNGPGDTTSLIQNPVVTYTNPGTYTVTLLAIEKPYCNTRDSTQTFITVYAKPTTAFSLTFSPCSNTISTTNNSTGGIGASPYVWSFGDGTATSSLTSPAHTYTTNGTFTVNLITSSAAGCTTSATQTISVFNFSPAVTSASVCNGETAGLNASGGTSYSWSPTGSLNNGSISSPVANPTTTTIYTVIINNNSPGYTCSSTLSTQVTVYPKPVSAFSPSINSCGGGVYFTDLSASNIAAWQWTLSATATSTIQNPYNFYSAGGTHTVILIVTNTDGCKDTSQQVITVGVPPPMAVNGNSLICAGSHAQLSASGGTSYQWTPTVSLDVSNIANPSASPTISTTYSVIITTTNGCSFLLNTTVNVSQLPAGPVSAIANPPYVISGNSTTLVYQGSPGSNITWYPFGSTTPGTGYTVSASPVKPTTYTVVVTTGACTQRATVFVEAYSEGCIDKDVYVPNTFTPNGDGQNDIFIVRGLKVQEIYFAVYNRWGEMVFETTDKTKGWDGIYKGRPADVGVFGYYLKVKCFNGDETFRKGNVTLIR